VPERAGAFVGGLLLAPEDHRHAAIRRELDHHVGAFVGYPDVVLPVDSHRMREAPRIEIVADLAQEFAVGAELEQLRRRRAVGGSRGVAARKDKDMPLGIDGHARGFAEIEVGRKLEEIGLRVEADLRHILLGSERDRQATDRRQRDAFHASPQ